MAVNDDRSVILTQTKNGLYSSHGTIAWQPRRSFLLSRRRCLLPIAGKAASGEGTAAIARNVLRVQTIILVNSVVTDRWLDLSSTCWYHAVTGFSDHPSSG